ncbi:UNVERIFIED_CONTAM: hypothetical protein K2H54_041336 [Gekko kuhli]
MEETLFLDQNFRHKAEKLLGIFQSELFQALLDIQEFYEATVTDAPPVTTTLRRARPKGYEKANIYRTGLGDFHPVLSAGLWSRIASASGVCLVLKREGKRSLWGRIFSGQALKPEASDQLLSLEASVV